MLRRAHWTGLLGSALALALVSPAAHAAAITGDTYHQDHRTSPKLQLEPAWTAPAGQTREAVTRAYLTDHAAALELPADLSNLRLDRVQESLLGYHYRYRQQINGVDVDKAEVIVSVAKSDGRVYRAYNNTYPVKTALTGRAAALSREAAFDAAWNRLRVSGELQAEPLARLVWVPEGADFRLSWIVNLETSAPYGGWELQVDAQTGRVVDTFDARHYRVKSELTETPVETRISLQTGPRTDRRAAFAAWEAKHAEHVASRARGLRAAGTGQVFDPDPRTTLQNDNLQDGDAPSAFTGAYFTRALQDITLSAGTYSLTGPWVDIIDWDTPSTPPSTTTTGNWNFTRGNNAFNDALTYFHIDQNQRHMQSLGFTGATGIQEGPIGTDTDGFQGADNSFYTSATNRMSFGHGCVDDSEDADVVLHEYGHAINYSINSSWSGGDTGAMGEGFGDYWAGSYSYVTLNGSTHRPTWVFSWDGHGTGNQCWPGRILDNTAVSYVHTTFYGAHSSIPGGVSDELWSAPLFKSLTDLIALGKTRDSVDQIILEAQFGLGSGIKMRDMGNAIVQAAGLLQPGEPHADTFVTNLVAYNIVTIPVVSLASTEPAVVTAGTDGVADPGETVILNVDIDNQGTLGATSVSAVLSSSTSGVVVNQGASAYPDLGAGVSGTNLTQYSITLPAGHPCGDPVALSLVVDYDDGAPKQTTLNAQLPTGTPVGASVSVSPALAIPDNTPAGVFSNLVISGTGATVTANLNIDIDLTHTYQGDLIVDLRSPMGTTVRLHNRTGGSTDNIIGNYPGTLTPNQALSAFIGQPLDGTWRMTVSDNAGIDTGTLNTWGINDVSGYNCESAPTDAPQIAGAPTAFSLAAASPNPFRPATTIRFAVPGAGADVALEIFDVSGRKVRTLVNGFQTAGTHAATWDGTADTGERVGAGIYFYQLQSADFSQTRKVVLVK